MTQLFREIMRNRELIWALALKELRVRYKRSTLGFLWALLNPLLMMVVLTLAFSAILHMPVRQYAVFILSGLMPWTFFAQSMSYSVESVVTNGDLLRKVRLAKSVFPIAAVISNVLNFLFSLIPMIAIILALRFPLHWTWIYIPVPLTCLFLFALGCGFVGAAINVFYRDVSHIIQIVLQAWFYLSPVMYSIDFLPQKYRTFFRLNPLVYLLNEFRLAIYYGQMPTAQSVAVSVLIGIGVLWLGYSLFKKMEHSFVYYV
jgi:ABC-2 type transport system permease protein